MALIPVPDLDDTQEFDVLREDAPPRSAWFLPPDVLAEDAAIAEALQLTLHSELPISFWP